MDDPTYGMNDEFSDDEDFQILADLVLFPRERQRFGRRMNHFLYWTDGEFFNKFRLSKICVRYLIDRLHRQLSSKTTTYHFLITSPHIFMFIVS